MSIVKLFVCMCIRNTHRPCTVHGVGAARADGNALSPPFLSPPLYTSARARSICHPLRAHCGSTTPCPCGGSGGRCSSRILSVCSHGARPPPGQGGSD